MSIKDILLVLDKGTAAPARTEFAALLANRIGARLTGLYARPFSIPYTACFSEAAMSGELVAEVERLEDEQQALVNTDFHNAMNRHGVDADWHSAIGDPLSTIAVASRYMDLVITSQSDPEAVKTAYWLPMPAEVAAHAAGAALIMPNTGTCSSDIRHVLVAWNASREASRAVREAIPFLKAADKVTVVVIDAKGSDTGHGQDPGVDITRYLARHGINVDLQGLTAADEDVHAVLLSHAFEIGADLLVAGCRGQSRLREFLLSGATRGLLSHMTLPILMAA